MWRSVAFPLMTSVAEISRFDLACAINATQTRGFGVTISEHVSKG